MTFVESSENWVVSCGGSKLTFFVGQILNSRIVFILEQREQTRGSQTDFQYSTERNCGNQERMGRDLLDSSKETKRFVTHDRVLSCTYLGWPTMSAGAGPMLGCWSGTLGPWTTIGCGGMLASATAHGHGGQMSASAKLAGLCP